MSSKPTRITSLDYIRGIAMLGVIGIHVGSFSLANPNLNTALFALLEVATRFSVPIFFFVSAFGLFYRLDLTAPFDYLRFIKRRFRTVLIPYIVWSLLYLLQYSVNFHDWNVWHPYGLLTTLFFGLGSYQLYFMVILLWFYALMPVWIAIMKRLSPPIPLLVILFILQLGFNHWSTVSLWSYPLDGSFFSQCIQFRLNWWVMHYLFIFLLGGAMALHYDRVYHWLQEHGKLIYSLGICSLMLIVGRFYGYLYQTPAYSPESAMNMVQQLSPVGLIYTVGATLFFLRFFTFAKLPARIAGTLALLGHHSYFIYLFHPFVLSFFGDTAVLNGIVLTTKKIIALYLVVALLSLLFAILTERIAYRLPLVGKLLIGTSRKK